MQSFFTSYQQCISHWKEWVSPEYFMGILFKEQIRFRHSFIIRMQSIWLYALFGSKWVIILTIRLLEKPIVLKCIESGHLFLSWSRSVGKKFLLLNREHWFLKNLLINSALFSLKYVMNIFSWKSGGTEWVFLLFKNLFNIG